MVTEHGREYTECGEHVGAADNIRDRIGKDGEVPQSGGQGQRRLDLLEEDKPQGVNQQDVHRVEQKVEPVIAIRAGPFPGRRSCTGTRASSTAGTGRQEWTGNRDCPGSGPCFRTSPHVRGCL